MNTYRPPQILREWNKDIPSEEVQQLLVYEDGYVCSASGRYAHSSGSTSCTWSEFLGGAIDALVTQTLGPKTLEEARQFVLERQSRISS